jgi:hypothetical protein
MFKLTIPAIEQWDEAKQEFVWSKETTLQLEHSLVSIAKWESKWCKPFLDNRQPKTDEETLDYIKCMTITQNVDPQIYNCITTQMLNDITAYIDAPMTATTFVDEKRGRNNGEIVTNEIIYHWMIALNIPDRFEKWHLNRLLTLIKVCNIKNQPSKKMSRRETMRNNTALNAARRQKFNSKG